ncbi:MAG: hypothetical protein HY268_21505 [Deltaproteobacteria bacterium]|nr:hypothetical protein [Deltaproteobacteria bacterium]
MYEQAIARDSQYAVAYAGVGWTYYFDWYFGWNPDRQALDRAQELA